MNANDLWMRVRGLLRRERVEQELDEELAFHVEMEARKLRAQGMGEAAAQRAARLKFGGADLVKEECRDARGTRPLEDFWRDVRYGVRVLVKDRGYTLAAV